MWCTRRRLRYSRSVRSTDYRKKTVRALTWFATFGWTTVASFCWMQQVIRAIFFCSDALRWGASRAHHDRLRKDCNASGGRNSRCEISFRGCRSDIFYLRLSCGSPSNCADRCTTSCRRRLWSDACKHALGKLSACWGTVSAEPTHISMELFKVTFARRGILMSVTEYLACVLTDKPTCFTGLRSRQMFTGVDGNITTEAPGAVPRVRLAQAVNMKPSFSRSSLALLPLLSKTPMVGSLPCSRVLPMQTDTVYLWSFKNGSSAPSLFLYQVVVRSLHPLNSM